MTINYNRIVTKQSFKKVQENLKDIGVSNISFLEGDGSVFYNSIDPYGESMTEEVMHRIMELSRDDFWFFLMKVSNLSHDYASGLNYNYELNVGTAAAMYLATNDCNVYINLPMFTRTVNTISKYYLWKLLNPKYNFRVLAESEEESQQFVNRICQENSMLPYYLRLSEFSIRDRVKIVRNPKNRMQADCIGRGCTSDICILNLEYIKYIDIILMRIHPILKACKTKMIAWSYIGKKGTFGKMVGDQIYSQCNKWIDEMYDIKLDRLKNSLMIVNHNYRNIFDNPDEKFEECEKMLNRDIELMRCRFTMIR